MIMRMVLVLFMLLLGGCAYIEPVLPLVKYEVRRRIVNDAIDVLEKRLEEIDKEEMSENGDG